MWALKRLLYDDGELVCWQVVEYSGINDDENSLQLHDTETT